ncbi:Glyceraldehyde-3-phosphate dehydrogenase [Sciurus carolinensis]|uniref:glyceraldehyde-3-phosphate dehydrogenase (phosphorylating) n=1 Tax=Sciurus carolinensis TaxID=30640 RepID=A0AA41MXP9_SCICA|nr:Glyceraldehyde-3-phosphate dehydrogenase [Sciurus carolinensis]
MDRGITTSAVAASSSSLISLYNYPDMIVISVYKEQFMVMDLTCHLMKYAKCDDIKKVVKQAWEGILGYMEDQVSSCNVNRGTHSSTFDAGYGLALNDHFVKLISLYSN